MTDCARVFLELHTGKRVQLYQLVPLDPDSNVATRAWRVWKPGKKKFYDVAIDSRGWISCTCADATFRNRACKHIRALKALGLLSKEKA